jgi:hypothetical protein
MTPPKDTLKQELFSGLVVVKELLCRKAINTNQDDEKRLAHLWIYFHTPSVCPTID